MRQCCQSMGAILSGDPGIPGGWHLPILVIMTAFWMVAPVFIILFCVHIKLSYSGSMWTSASRTWSPMPSSPCSLASAWGNSFHFITGPSVLLAQCLRELPSSPLLTIKLSFGSTAMIFYHSVPL